MGSKAKKRAAPRKRTAAASRKSRAKSKAATAAESARNRFVSDLLTRGEAAKLDPNGKLPLEATHVITKEGEDGTATVRRLRYKLF